jgi:hypothetical protein
MVKRVMLVPAMLCVASLSWGVTAATGQSSTDDELFARLSGDRESPKGDADGKGAASVLVDGKKVCIAIGVTRLDDVQAAHIHRGAQGVNGPIVVDPKVAVQKSGNGVVVGGCATVTSSLAQAIKRNPGRYYVNVHTSKFPAGAIRGQLRRFA